MSGSLDDRLNAVVLDYHERMVVFHTQMVAFIKEAMADGGTTIPGGTDGNQPPPNPDVPPVDDKPPNPPGDPNESKDGTTITPGQGEIIDYKGRHWAIGADKQVWRDGQLAGFTANVAFGYYRNVPSAVVGASQHVFFHCNSNGDWYYWSDDLTPPWTGTAAPDGAPTVVKTPPPVVTPPPAPTGRGLMLPPGPLSTRGNQIVGADGTNVRIASIGCAWVQPDGWRKAADDLARHKALGFNCIRVSWFNARRDEFLSAADYIVSKAQAVNMRVVICNHTNEGGHGPQDNWGAQQKNGLWYDLGGASDGTDGGGNRGTVDQAKFKADWLAFATRFHGNDTVIGFDIRNEPLGYGGMCSWGDGNKDHDIRMMYQDVGNAIHAIDNSKLIICEALGNYAGAVEGGAPVYADLTGVHRSPVILNTPNKVVYSVHAYPGVVSGVPQFNDGQPAIDLYNRGWGFIVKDGIGPMWIGEMGSNCLDAATRAWAQTMVDYCNGKAQGGPSFSAGQQGISIDWWSFGDQLAEVGDATLPGVFAGSNVRVEQQRYWSQMLFNR